MTDAERFCLQETLERLGYYSGTDQLEQIGEAMTGVAGRSRVFRVLLRRQNSTRKNFVAKFDAKRTAKEWAALAILNQSDVPHNFVSNVDGASGLKNMPPENGLIVYNAANSLAPNDELLTLQKLFVRHGTAKADPCKASFRKVMEVLGHIYQNGRRDLVNHSWIGFFPEIQEHQLDLYQRLTGHQAAAAIMAVNELVGDQKLSPIHGDLNLTNILVAMREGLPEDAMVIDFADYQAQAPLVLDFVKMETELWLETAAIHWDESLDGDPPNARGELQDCFPSLVTDPSKATCSHPALKCYAQLAALLRQQALNHLGGTNFKNSYGLPLAFAFLRALTYKTVKESPFKSALAKTGLAAAWQLSQGETAASVTFLHGSATPIHRPLPEGEFRVLIQGKMAGILNRACMKPFMTSLYHHLAGSGSPSDLAMALAQLMLDKSILEVQACLIKAFNDSDSAETRQAWDLGESLVGWRILGNVNPGCCTNLRKNTFFDVPLQTLLGAEIVLSWHEQRHAAFELRAGVAAGQTAVTCVPESGPHDLDFVHAVTRELLVLMNLQSERTDLERLCKLVDGALQMARTAGRPYYLVVDLSKKHQPLATESVQVVLRQYLPSLTIAFLRHASSTELNLLVMGEDQLEGAILYYLNQKKNWHAAHP